MPWYDNWIVALSAAIGAGVGLVYMLIVRPYERSDAIAGDAIHGTFKEPEEPAAAGPGR